MLISTRMKKVQLLFIKCGIGWKNTVLLYYLWFFIFFYTGLVYLQLQITKWLIDWCLKYLLIFLYSHISVRKWRDEMILFMTIFISLYNKSLGTKCYTAKPKKHFPFLILYFYLSAQGIFFNLYEKFKTEINLNYL